MYLHVHASEQVQQFITCNCNVTQDIDKLWPQKLIE